MADLVDLSNRLLAGEAAIEEHHPFAASNRLEEVADGVAFVESFANVSALATDEGLALVDTGSAFSAAAVQAALGAWRADPVDTVVYTHGHIDHVMGTEVFEQAARDAGRPGLRVVAHEAVDDRFDRYVLTAGYNAVINQRQFQVPGLRWPVDYRRPDVTYRRSLDVVVGGVALQLHHAQGETDDHTWVWVPDRRTLLTGDLIIWCSPNAGNPQKVQRFAREWSVALREMAALEPEVLLPGHGLPVVGEANVRMVLTDTADLLDHLHDETLRLMNEGATLDEVLHAVQAPAHLVERPYLRPIYDEPEFVVRNVWRRYGGWYDGDQSHLKPAPRAQLAAEVAALAGGAGRLAERAEELAAAGDHRLAGHLVEWAGLAAPDDAGVHRTRAALLQQRAEAETSLMAKGIYRAAARDSEQPA